MPPHTQIVPIEMFPKMEKLVTICYSRQKDLAWLELRNTQYLVNNGHHKGGEVYRVLVGAVDRGGLAGDRAR